MNTITATHARSNLFQLLKQTLKENLVVRISSKEGDVVMLSVDDYDNLLETAELLSEPGLKESIKKADKDIAKGKVFSFAEVFKKL